MYNEYSKRKLKEKQCAYKEWQRKALKRKQARSVRKTPFNDRTYAEQQMAETLRMLKGD